MKTKHLLVWGCVMIFLAIFGNNLSALDAHSAVAQLAVADRSQTATWEPPIGIPQPEFGITEMHNMYVGQTYDYDGTSGAYKDAGNGPYTHYIDNTAETATDTDNPFGTPDKPRLTIPEELTPGSVVELHGGPYNYITPGQNEDVEFATGRGTAAQPIFIRGFSQQEKTEFTRRLRIIGSYFILENLLFTDAGGLSIRAPSDHIGVRYTELTRFNHPESKSHYNLLPGGDKEVDFNSDIVYYHNYFHDNGYPATSTPELKNSFQVTGNTRRIWIVDNIMENGTEDGIHIMLGTSSHEKFLPEDIYIGRNIIHHYTENAIDVKPSRDVIISENIMYGYRPINIPPSDGAQGDGVVLNYEEWVEGQVVENHFIIFNTFYDCEIGIRAEYSGYVYGNVFYGISQEVSGSNSGAVTVYLKEDAISDPMYIINNTMYDVWRGIYHRQGTNIYAYNNAVVKAEDAHVQYQTNSEVREFHNNLLWNADGEAVLKVGGSGARYYRGMNNFPNLTEFSGSLEFDPLFASIDDSNPSYLQLTEASPAVEHGIYTERLQTLLEQFSTTFGPDIHYDRQGTTRPINMNWDIGAYEFAPALVLHGTPADQSIYLNWILNSPQSPTSWTLHYDGPQGDQPPTITGIPAPTHAYSLTGLTNYVPYTVTLTAIGTSPVLSDTVQITPRAMDKLIYLPLVLR